MDWAAQPSDFQGLAGTGAAHAPSTSSVSLVDVLARIATALERGGDDGGPVSGAAAAAVVAAAASAVAEAQRPFAAQQQQVAPPQLSLPPGGGSPASVPGTTGASRTADAAAAPSRSPPSRDRGGMDRAASNSGLEESLKPGKASATASSSRGTADQPGMLP